MNIYAGKPYDCFMMLGRVQHIHIGHEYLIDTGFKWADRGVLFIGSSQESGTERNPFDISTRIDMVREIYGDALLVKPIEDMDPTYKDGDAISSAWGDYVMDRILRYIRKKPDVMIYGNDEFRSTWFSAEAIKDTLEIVVPRSKIAISATKMRSFLVEDNFEAWSEFANPKLHKHYQRLRNELLAVESYKQMHEIFLKTSA